MAVPEGRSANRAACKAADKLTHAVNNLADEAARTANIAKDKATALANRAADEIAHARYKALDEINARNRAAKRDAAAPIK
jgi:hypothetical protein